VADGEEEEDEEREKHPRPAAARDEGDRELHRAQYAISVRGGG
jgi:hypothetical protein